MSYSGWERGYGKLVIIDHGNGVRTKYAHCSRLNVAVGDWVDKGTQIDLVIERKDGIVHLCEAKFTETELLLNKDYTTHLRQRRAIFKEATKTKKNIVTTLFTTYPAIKNEYYLEEIHSEIAMDFLFQ